VSVVSVVVSRLVGFGGLEMHRLERRLGRLRTVSFLGLFVGSFGLWRGRGRKANIFFAWRWQGRFNRGFARDSWLLLTLQSLRWSSAKIQMCRKYDGAWKTEFGNIFAFYQVLDVNMKHGWFRVAAFCKLVNVLKLFGTLILPICWENSSASEWSPGPNLTAPATIQAPCPTFPCGPSQTPLEETSPKSHEEVLGTHPLSS